MSKNTRWTPEQLQKLGLVEHNGSYVKASSLVARGKVEKIDPSVTTFQQSEIDRVNNKKIKNATKIEENGIKFDSKLEKYMYDLLRGAQIDFEFQKVYTLQQKFRYRTEAIRAITLTVDFWLPEKNIIIDTKGMQTQQGAIRWKLLKSYLKHIEDSEPEIFMPSNKKECEVLLNKLLYDNYKK